MSNGDFTILTRSSDRNRSRMFEKSAAKFGLNLVIDEGHEHFVDTSSFERAAQRIESFSTKYAMITDAFDVLVARWDPGELAREIDAADGHLLISGEPECWPGGPWSATYPPALTAWPYACGGQFVGTRESMLAMVREIYARRDEVVAGGGSQEIMHCMVRDGRPLKIDQECRIFQCMRTGVAKAVEFRDGLPFNSITGARPMFLHFNGGDQSPGMEDWARRLDVL